MSFAIRVHAASTEGEPRKDSIRLDEDVDTVVSRTPHRTNPGSSDVPHAKLTPPRLPATFVDRPALLEKLERASDAPLTIVTGFAGAGKTMLLASWLRQCRRARTAWLSCDAWESDAARFWTSVVTSLRQVAPDFGADALDWIETGKGATVDTVASLVNDLSRLVEPLVIVIDDIHVVPASAIQGLDELVEWLPGRVHIVIGSRSDPVLSLHRWRTSNRMAELRDADLRMAAHEVEALLHAFDVDLDAADVDALVQRTEGWVAGVQLAALSLRGRLDAPEFVRAFTGDQRNIADFLVGEVLERQDDDIVEFLMATSIVDSFGPALCGYLTGRPDSAAVLHAAERASLFIVALDDERRSYRYHQLFRDLLRAELRAADSGRAKVLHRRAACWYEEHGEITSAIHQSIRGGDVEHAFELLHDHLLEGWFVATSGDLGAWLDELPEPTVALERDRILDFAIGLGVAGRIEASGFWLQRAQRSAATLPETDDVFDARLAAGWALWHCLRGETQPAIERARGAMSLLPPGVDMTVDAAPLILTRALLWGDDTDTARRTYEDATAGWTDPVAVASLRSAASLTECVAGNLRLARQLADAALAGAQSVDAPDHPVTADARVTLGFLALESNDLEGAERWFEHALSIAEQVRPPLALFALLGLAQVLAARGEWRLSSAAIERARTVLPIGAQSPLMARTNALDARFALQQGDVARAELLLGALPDGPRRALAEARVRLATNDLVAARSCVDRIRSLQTTTRIDLECTLIEAQIAGMLGADTQPLLQRVIAIAQPQRFLRTLIATDPIVAKLLGDFLVHSPSDPYFDELLTEIDRVAKYQTSPSAEVDGSTLSEREITVLRCLATRMTTREIAGELFISINTLKTHVKSIYRKLDASSRTEAIAQAKSRRLL